MSDSRLGLCQGLQAMLVGPLCGEAVCHRGFGELKVQNGTEIFGAQIDRGCRT